MHSFLIHKRGDDVGVAVCDIEPGQRVAGVFMDDDSVLHVDAVDPVPLGHKIAITHLDAGAEVIEYGVRIGTTPDGIALGQHVHTHNLRSARW